MKKSNYFLFFLLLTVFLTKAEAQRDSVKAYNLWKDMRVGLFVHWGTASGKGLNPSHSHARKSELNTHGTVPAEVYDNYYKTFNPTKYNPDQWLKLAYDAGMRYTVFVAKHHDGFCMFNTKATNYSIMATPYGKDVSKEFAEACKRQGLALGWQFSPKDWKNPDFNTNQEKYNQYYLQLINELTKNYGPVSVLWFDGTDPVPTEQWKEATEKLPAMVYENNPNTMLGVHGAVKEDFLSFEYRVGPFNRIKPWETCEPINPSGWVYNKPMEPYPFEKLLQTLVYTVSRDGNYLLDVGPMETGELYPPDAARLQQFADWMKINKEAIHGTRGGPYRDGTWGGATCKNNTVYLFISDEVKDSYILPMLDARITGVKRLDNGPVKWTVKNNQLVLQFPKENKSRQLFTVVKLMLDRRAYSLKIVDGQANLARQAKIIPSAVRDNDSRHYGTDMLFDSDGQSAWEDRKEDPVSTLTFEWAKPVTISSLSLSEKGQPTGGWAGWYTLNFQIADSKNGPWRTVATNTDMLGHPPFLNFPKTVTRYARLELQKNAGWQSQISELRVFEPLN